MISGAYTNVFDFMTAAQIADVKTGSLTLDVGPAIQLAFDAAYNVATGTGRKTVFFPNGSYRVNATLNTAGISLLGESMSGSKIYYYGINACLTCTTGENTFKNLLFDGSNANAGSSIGIQYTGTLRHTFENNIVQYFFRGIKISGTAVYSNSFSKSYFLGNSIHVFTSAIGSGQFATACYFTENEFTAASDPNYGIYLEDTEGFTFERNIFQSNLSKFTIFIYYFSAFTNAYMNHRIINNWFEENGNSQVGSADIWVDGDFGALKGVLILNNQHYTSNGNNPTYGIRADNTDGLTVQNNTWNLGSPWVYLFKSGVGNKNWVVSNPLIIAAQEMKQHLAVLGKAAASSQTVNAAANDVILFGTPLDNYSGLWNTSTGAFTCAAQGIYMFDLTIHFESSTVGQQFNLTVLVNASAPTVAPSMVCTKQTVGDEGFTFVGYLSCAATDVITFKCQNLGASNRNISIASQGKVTLIDYVI